MCFLTSNKRSVCLKIHIDWSVVEVKTSVIGEIWREWKKKRIRALTTGGGGFERAVTESRHSSRTTLGPRS